MDLQILKVVGHLQVSQKMLCTNNTIKTMRSVKEYIQKKTSKAIGH